MNTNGKRIAALALIPLLVAALLAGCGGKSGDEMTTSEPTYTYVDDEPTEYDPWTEPEPEEETTEEPTEPPTDPPTVPVVNTTRRPTTTTRRATTTTKKTTTTTKKTTTKTTTSPVYTTIADGAGTNGTGTTTTTTTRTSTTSTTTSTALVKVLGVAFTGSSSYNLLKGRTQQLGYQILPSNATNKGVNFFTSNAAVATVSATGLVTAQGAGTANITIITTDPNAAQTYTDTITVNVTEPAPVLVTDFYVSQQSGSIGTLKVGTTITLVASNFKGEGGKTPTNASVTWSSSDTSTAQVGASTGVVYGVNPGTVTITATANDSGRFAKPVTITVTLT
ncbi:MAG: Ig-like domain-containing protein [Oscillospiraceae bacterium]|nr:Ig-like domain-containing protein [Oscillospiraceae bacterium]